MSKLGKSEADTGFRTSGYREQWKGRSIGEIGSFLSEIMSCNDVQTPLVVFQTWQSGIFERCHCTKSSEISQKHGLIPGRGMQNLSE